MFPIARAVAADDIRGYPGYPPEVSALPLGAALSLADRKMRGLCSLPVQTQAIVVVSSLDDEPLGAHHRDLLWQAFGLPVFGQMRGWDGAVIARECEVHDGLHFDGGIATLNGENLIVAGKPTDLSAEIVREHCECGLETPRLRNIRDTPRFAEFDEAARASVFAEVQRAPVFAEPVRVPVFAEAARTPAFAEPVRAPVLAEPVRAPALAEAAHVPVFAEPVRVPALADPVRLGQFNDTARLRQPRTIVRAQNARVPATRFNTKLHVRWVVGVAAIVLGGELLLRGE